MTTPLLRWVKSCAALVLCVGLGSPLLACQSPWPFARALGHHVEEGGDDGPAQSDWQSMDEGAPFVAPTDSTEMSVVVDHIVVDTQDAAIAYVQAQDRSYISTRSGSSWKLANDPVALQGRFVIDPSRAGVAYTSSNATLVRTGDGGRSWEDAQGNLATRTPPPGKSNWSWPIAVAQANSDVIFAVVPAPDDSMLTRSTDGGSTWHDLPPFGHGQCCDTMVALSADHAFLLKWEGLLNKTFDGGQTWTSTYGSIGFVDALVVDPSDATVLYLISRETPSGSSKHELRKSVDAGETWSTLSATSLPTPVDQLAVDARGTLYAVAGTSGTEKSGVFVSTDGGDTFIPSNDGLGSNEITAIAAGPDCVAYAGTRSGGIFKTTNGAGTCQHGVE